MDVSRPIEMSPPKPSQSCNWRDFGYFARLFARRFFEPIPYNEQAAKNLSQLSERGEVVHIMRSVGVLNFFYLAYFLLRSSLPPLRAAIGLRFSFWSPFRRLFRLGSVAKRLGRAMDENSSALVFLREPTGLLPGPKPGNDPFFALIARARTSARPIYLVPDLFLWLARPRNLRPSIRDLVFGDPERPGKVITAWSFMLNHRTALFRVGEPIDLTAFVRENASSPDSVLVRKVRGALFHHLARETQAIVGPPLKHPDRIIEETLRDRALRSALDQIAAEQNLDLESVRKKARRDLVHIANRYIPLVVACFRTLISFLLSRLYQGVEIDEKGMERVLELKREAPLVFCPSHKSNFDSGLMGWIFADRGVVPPLAGAGANLSFWPLGWILRRACAFFLRRTFKGDPIYAATFKAYMKKLVREGYSQEFYIEGGRSRTGKLLSPKLGMLSFVVNAVLDGARPDIYFVPVAIDYDKLVEARSYAREMAGGEKKPESIKSLLTAPKILAGPRFGRIYLSFGEQISLKEFISERVKDPANITEEEKRSATAALAQRIAYSIGRAITVTPVALLSAGLLAHRRRGIGATELAERIDYMRAVASKENLRISPVLMNAPSNPSLPGPINEVVKRFIEDELLKTQIVAGETIYSVPEDKRAALCIYKNNLVHFFAIRSFVSSAVLSTGCAGPLDLVRERFAFLVRLLKLEFSFQAGLSNPEPLFDEAIRTLEQEGLVVIKEGKLQLPKDTDAQAGLAFLRDLTRELLEAYRIFIATLPKAGEPIDRKTLVAAALEQGRSDFLAGITICAEALSRPPLENALALCLDQNIIARDGEKKVVLTGEYRELVAIEELLAKIDQYSLPVRN